MKRKPVTSSNVASKGYSKRTRTLEISFKPYKPNQPQPVYQYLNVPPEVSAAFDKAESKGKYLHANVIGKFEVEKVD